MTTILYLVIAVTRTFVLREAISLYSHFYHNSFYRAYIVITSFLIALNILIAFGATPILQPITALISTIKLVLLLQINNGK